MIASNIHTEFQLSMQNEERVGVRGFTPRIRHITGIRIHQLTLPESLAYASKLRIDASFREDTEHDEAKTPIAGPSSPSLQRAISNTPHGMSRRERRISTSTLPGNQTTRERASSTSVISSSPARATRSTRPRAPTLAGEAMGLGLERSPVIGKDEAEEPVRTRRLARCFITLKLPEHTETAIRTSPRVTKADSPRDAMRQRTISMDNHRSLSTQPDVPVARTVSDKSRQRRSQMRPTVSTRTSSNSVSRSPLASPMEVEQAPVVPFYISPIHRQSTHPRFLSLTQDDLAGWLTIEEAAGMAFDLEIWYEDTAGWKLLDAVDKRIDLNRVKRLDAGEQLQENTVLLTFSSDPKALYRVCHTETSPQGPLGPTERGVVERSMRETRMKRGVGIGGLHQLVNMQSVLVDTRRGVEDVQAKIDRMLLEDVDRRALLRDIEERTGRCKWIHDKIDEVSKTTREVSARVTLRDQAVEERRSNLDEGHARLDLLHAQAKTLSETIDRIDSERSDLLNMIHHYRTNHVQTLDSMFPIVPLHPPSLLYSILDVPLPIPLGPKDPAPPPSIPPSNLPEGVSKIDERTTAAALGYVAMVVQLLGNLGGAISGLPYPVTCAGSRSLVKDVVSVMQGPRSFPLYVKGVERYRYEYAVFLLNKNIETLMQESNIRLLDLRHTLPNLKILLLTLSSPAPSSFSSSYPVLSRSSTFVDSRSSSRQTSASYIHPFASSRSPGSSTDGTPYKGFPSGVNSPSPVKAKSGLRRSLQVDTGFEEEEKSLTSGTEFSTSEDQIVP